MSAHSARIYHDDGHPGNFLLGRNYFFGGLIAMPSHYGVNAASISVLGRMKLREDGHAKGIASMSSK